MRTRGHVRGVQVSCDWLRADHVTSCSPLIGQCKTGSIVPGPPRCEAATSELGAAELVNMRQNEQPRYGGDWGTRNI